MTWFRRGIRLVSFIGVPLLILFGLAGGVGYVKLRHGPISLTFLAGPIERGISSELAGLGVTVGDAELGLNEEGGIEVRVRDLEISEADGDVVIAVPQSAVEPSLSALWSLRLVPAKVELIKPRIGIGYSGSAGLTLTISDPSASADASDIEAPPAPVPATNPKPVKSQGSVKTARTSFSQPIELARLLSATFARARQRGGAASYLRSIGLRDATVTLDTLGRASTWTMPEASLSLNHRRWRSTVSGYIRLQSQRGPWELTFRAQDSERKKTLTVTTIVSGLVPSVLAASLPQLSVFGNLDVPLSGKAVTSLSSDGELLSANLSLDVGRGMVRLPSISKTAAFFLDSGEFTLAYDGSTRRALLAPAVFFWGESRIALEGSIAQESGASGAWAFNLAATDGRLTAEEFDGASLPLAAWAAKGRVLPDRELVELSSFVLKAGDGAVGVRGEVSTRAGDDSMRVEGTTSPMEVATGKVLWPRVLAPGARRWVGDHVSKGRLGAGSFRYVSGSYLDAAGVRKGDSTDNFSMSVEAFDVAALPTPRLVPLEAPRLTVTAGNDGVVVAVPEAAFVLGPDRRVPLRAGQFMATELNAAAPAGEILFRSEGPLSPVLELLRRASISVGTQSGIDTASIEGNVDGQFSLHLPLLADLDPSDIRIEGEARVKGGKADDIIGTKLDVQDAAITFTFDEHAINASGTMLVNGVPAGLGWRHLNDAPPDKQPPLRITATIDSSDRDLLGLDVNHLVQGDVPVEITMTRTAENEPQIRLRADLSNATVSLDRIAWKKPPGRVAILECDVVQKGAETTDLENFRIAGDSIAIEGHVSLGAKQKLKEFEFPQFVLDVVSRLAIKGSLRPDDVLAVKVSGDTFDGRAFFRSLFAPGQLTEQDSKVQRPAAGIDIEADIGTLLGFSEVSLRGLNIKASRRGDRLVALDGRGIMDGGKELTVTLEQEKGQPRILVADSPDAGQAFRLIGFYPNLQGGHVRLNVNLDGRGPAEMTGTLWVDSFRVLGDPVANEVLSGANGLGTIGAQEEKPKTAKGETREIFYFDRVQAAFAVGHGQFVIEEASLRGPSLGASMRGKVDYGARTIDLGGTYAPLSIFNRAFAGIPIVDPLLNGPRGEGMLGATFAIQGSLAKPQVIVNPLAVLTPGIFREFMPMTNPNPQVLDRPGAKRERASGGAPSSQRSGDKNGVLDGWSSETLPAAPDKK